MNQVWQKESAINDFEIVLDVLAGNRDAYAFLVQKYEAKVRSSCLTMLSNAEEADDAAQDIFIKAYQALGTFKGNSQFSTWIYRITVNHCLNLLKKRKRQNTESWDALVEKGGEKIEKLFSASRVSDPAAFSGDYPELLAKLLAHLPEKSRQMLVLREIQELSYQELAETLQCTVDAVKARLKRTRQELEFKFRHFLSGAGV